MDRPALNGFEIVEELEKEFGLQSYPVNWATLSTGEKTSRTEIRKFKFTFMLLEQIHRFIYH
jgi:peptide subunit release factor RF-3